MNRMNLQFTRPNQPPPVVPLDIVLASQSVGRKLLLEKLGLRFRVVVSRIDEETIIHADPLTTLKKRAAAKAEEVATHPRIYTLAEEGKTLVVAADSMAVVGKKMYGKSIDREDTRRMLKILMGRTHHFVTAVTIFQMEGTNVVKRWEKAVTTKVTMRRLSAVELDSYIARFDFSRFAAGYALNEAPWDLVTKVDGSYTNVIGLPFEVLLPILRKLEVIV